MDGLIVPSSIQRIRSFLIEMCGMKVKPWASTEETLAALHTMLVARHGCDIFWTSLRVLLETLARDLKTRQESAPGGLVDNEVLDSERYAALLDEIRACLARQKGNLTGDVSTASFRRLATALSAPALGLLLLLGGATTVGCDHTAFNSTSKTPDAAAIVADAAMDPSQTKSDAPIFILPPTPDTKPTAPDTRPPEADTGPPHDAVTTGPDGATVTIQNIMDSCNVPSWEQGEILVCLAALRKSWTTGITEELSGASCATVSSRLDAFACMYTDGSSCRPTTSQDFAPGSAPYCAPVIIYMGVRFV